MRSVTRARTVALSLLPVLAGAAGVAVADGPSGGATPAAPAALPLGLQPGLGDLEAIGAARTALERRRAERRARGARTLRFPVAGPADYGGAAARFGNDRGSHIHEGQDVFAPAGTPLRAIASGVVLETGGGDARGNYVALHDPRRDRTYVYLHMQGPASVRPGERVRAGERVGRVGCTGRCFGDHLHLEVRLGRSAQGRPIDPMGLLQRARRG